MRLFWRERVLERFWREVRRLPDPAIIRIGFILSAV